MDFKNMNKEDVDVFVEKTSNEIITSLRNNEAANKNSLMLNDVLKIISDSGLVLTEIHKKKVEELVSNWLYLIESSMKRDFDAFLNILVDLNKNNQLEL
jgi:hypothetical protein